MCKLDTAIIEKPTFYNISESMYDNKIKTASTYTFSWSGIMIKPI